VESQIEQTQRENTRRFSLALSVVQIWFFLLGISYFSALAFRLIRTGGIIIELGSLFGCIACWWVARGLALRINFFRLLATVLAGAWILTVFYFIWQMLFNGMGLTIYFMGRPDPSESSRAWIYLFIGINIIMSFYTIVVLLMRQGRELFKTSSSSKVNQ
jgi:hypothetical protein